MHLWEIYVICTHDDIKKVRFSFFFFFLHEYDSLISKVAKMTDIRARCMDKKKKNRRCFLASWTVDTRLLYLLCQNNSVFVLPEAIFKKKKMRHLAWLYVPLRNSNKDDFNNLKKDMLYVPSIHIFFFLRYAL